MPKFEEFKGRVRELNLLDELWQAPDATLLVLCGRCRVGKTRLLKQWINQTKVPALYLMAEPSTSAAQLRSFFQALYNFANPEPPALPVPFFFP